MLKPRTATVLATAALATMQHAGLRTGALFARPLFDDPSSDPGPGPTTPPAPNAPPAPASVNFSDLREEFNVLKRQSEQVFAKAQTEKRTLTDDETKENETRFKRMESIKSTIDAQTRFAALAFAGDANKPAGTVTLPQDHPGRAAFEANQGNKPTGTQDPKAEAAAFAKALNEWAATGVMPRQFATITTATASGALLPRSIALPVVPSAPNAFREAHAAWGLQPIETETTEALKVPIMDASAGGAVAENASSETTNDPSLAQTIDLTPTTYQSGTAWFSNMSLGANSFDLTTYVQQDLTYAKELGFESAIVAAMIADANITQAVVSSSTTGFTFDNMSSLNSLLPKRYQRFKVIVLSGPAYAAAEKLTTGDGGQLVCTRDANNVLRFLGTPVVRSDYLEALTANKTIGLCVSLVGFKIRDVRVQQLARYTQNSAKPGQTGFNLIGFHGYGYAVSAVAKLKTAAS